MTQMKDVMSSKTAISFLILFFIVLLSGTSVLYMLYEYSRDLPDYHQLADYEPPVTTRIYAKDGHLLAEYATERRTFVPLSAMPQRVAKAFLSAEDKSFYQHAGLDLLGIFRAIFVNVKNYGTNHKPMGASTITQQVAKNFLLTNEVSLDRKIKEAILAIRIEHTLSKSRILELYLNEIYLGSGSYGVAAAAMNYFNKSLDELTIGETAFLAALPKAPNNYHPLRNPIAARERRDWVINRMAEDGYITTAEAKTAQNELITLHSRAATEFIKGSDHFSEDVRRLLIERYGECALYEGGLHVRATLDPELQKVADRTLRHGLIEYDRRHGWRGAIGHVAVGLDWVKRLHEVPQPSGLPDEWLLSVILTLNNSRAEIGLPSGRIGVLPLSELKWARSWKADQTLGKPVKFPSDVLGIGDVVMVELLSKEGFLEKGHTNVYGLRQIPQIEGALVALESNTGRVLAMAGGFSYERSEFNRATQALRQPGSAFKPFVYLAALESGYTPSSIIMDAPCIIDQGPGLPKWKPQNYDGNYMGPTTLRLGIEKSRNLVTVRLAQAIGVPIISDYARRFGLIDEHNSLLSGLAMSLGAVETTVLKLTGAYAMLANGGKRIRLTLIDRIQDRNGHTIYRHDDRLCSDCQEKNWYTQPVPTIQDNREQIATPLSTYQIVSLLQGVVQYGTGRSVSEIRKALAGKTGTSNDSMDTWFVGFSPDLAVGVFIGFDEPRSLGQKETGGNVAAPVFRDFMREALLNKPTVEFHIPTGIRLVRVHHATGLPASDNNPGVILEAFKPGTIPKEHSNSDGGMVLNEKYSASDGSTPDSLSRKNYADLPPDKKASHESNLHSYSLPEAGAIY